jgi:hypothetical protein
MLEVDHDYRDPLRRKTEEALDCIQHCVHNTERRGRPSHVRSPIVLRTAPDVCVALTWSGRDRVWFAEGACDGVERRTGRAGC